MAEMVKVELTESEAETVLLALDYFRRYHMGEYSSEDGWMIREDIKSVSHKLRDA